MTVYQTGKPYLPDGLPVPQPAADGLDTAYWSGLTENRLMVQRCGDCGTWQWGPEWLCHRCHGMNMVWTETEPTGVIYSWQRPWHPVHPALKGFGPYIVVLVELPRAGNIRMIGNLLGAADQTVEIGAPVSGVFEHRTIGDQSFSLLQWQHTT